MKIALFHNYMDNIGGAEMVGLTLARDLHADFYSTNIDEDKIAKMGFLGIKLKSIGSIPIHAPFRQQMALWRFRNLNLGKKYDFYIIDGDWAVSAAVYHKPCLWYVHSPIREIWDAYEFTRQHVVPWYLRSAFDAWVWYNRYLNRKYIEHVTHIVCNSENTKRRIKKYLNKDAHVIHPPTDISTFYYKNHQNYWLSVNRLFTHKRVDIQMKAFAKIPEEKLVIVGSYEQSRHFQQYIRYIQSIKPSNVEIKSWVDNEELRELYAGCKGFITTAYDEDFGMTAIEAMASGKPVIAPNEGGYTETVISGITGELISDIDADKLVAVINKVRRNPERYKSASLEQAKKFGTDIFISKIKKVIGI